MNEQLQRQRDEQRELEIKIESMAIDVKEKPAMGNSKLVCSNCHHRGHRNQSSKPCFLQKCTNYTFCGIREKHPEYFSRLNNLKSDLKRKSSTIKELEEQIRSMNDFSSNSEYHFIKNLIPRLYEVDKGYKMNKPKLMRDIRMLRKCLDGKIPPMTSNDPEQLRILLRKCRMNFNLELDSPDDTNSQSEIGLVSTTMACSSPVKNTFVHHEECMTANSVSVSCNDDDASVERKRKKIKKNKKRRKKHKRRRRRYSSSSSSDSNVSDHDTKCKRPELFAHNIDSFSYSFPPYGFTPSVMNPHSAVPSHYSIGGIPVNSPLTQFQTQGYILRPHYGTPPIPANENRENSHCQDYNLPNYPRCMAEEVFHANTFLNPPINTQTATVNNTINLPASPQKWSGFETLVEVANNKVQKDETG